jgi:hypothetical protein
MEQSSLKPAPIPLPAVLPAIPHGSTNEKLIVGKLVTDLLSAGFWISVYDGEETTVRRSTDAETIFKALASTDEDYLNVGRTGADGMKAEISPIGWVRLIWGNDNDIISDWVMHSAIDPIVEKVNDYSEALR